MDAGLWPLAAFAAVTSITPGPNNLMLLASGALHGFCRTLPHMVGIVLGVGVMLSAACAGLGAAFARMPALADALRWIGFAYLCWLAWKLLRAGAPGEAGGARAARPLGWLEAALFQLVNPKAWMMVLTAAASFILPLRERLPAADGLGVALFAVVGFACIAPWAGFGSLLRRWLSDRRRQLAFNALMGTLTLVTALAMLR